MTNGTKVTKRNGNSEPLDLNKLHVMVEEACKDLAGVSASQVEIQSGIQFYDGITTDFRNFYDAGNQGKISGTTKRRIILN